jgi:hypothetical protein
MAMLSFPLPAPPLDGNLEIIQPPPDIRIIVDKTSELVAKYGHFLLIFLFFKKKKNFVGCPI